MSKYTPMPWFADGRYIVAYVPKGRPGGEVIATCGPTAGSLKHAIPNKANAHLIAAACNAVMKVNPENPIAAAEALPDLLEACTTALKMLNAEIETAPIGRDTQPEKVTAKVLKAAIAKAERKTT